MYNGGTATNHQGDNMKCSKIESVPTLTIISPYFKGGAWQLVRKERVLLVEKEEGKIRKAADLLIQHEAYTADKFLSLPVPAQLAIFRAFGYKVPKYEGHYDVSEVRWSRYRQACVLAPQTR